MVIKFCVLVHKQEKDKDKITWKVGRLKRKYMCHILIYLNSVIPFVNHRHMYIISFVLYFVVQRIQ